MVAITYNNNIDSMIGSCFLPTSNRVPKDEWRLIAIDIYGRCIMEHQPNKSNIIYITLKQFNTDFKLI
jgi:hypothetical protein